MKAASESKSILSGHIRVPTIQAKGYWIVFSTVTDPEKFGMYTSHAAPVIAAHGGRVLVRGDVVTTLEGLMLGRPFLIEFPSYAAAQACYRSEGYQEAIALRAGAAQFQIVIADGFVPTPKELV